MKKLLHDEVVSLIKEACGDRYQLLDPYVDSRTKNHVRCNTCGNEWFVQVRFLYAGRDCPVCSLEKLKRPRKLRGSHEDMLLKLSPEMRSAIVFLDEYNGRFKPISVQCNTCGRKWTTTPAALYRGEGCWACARKRKGVASRLSHEEYVEKIEAAHHGKIRVRGPYLGGNHTVEAECLECGRIWEPNANRLRYRGCSKCCSSKGEKKIEAILIAARIGFTPQKTFDDLVGPGGGKLRFDFAIEEDGVLRHLIEYDGMHHFKPIKYMGGQQRFDRQVEIDAMKDRYCVERGIKLIRIPYHQFKVIGLEMLV